MTQICNTNAGSQALQVANDENEVKQFYQSRN